MKIKAYTKSGTAKGTIDYKPRVDVDSQKVTDYINYVRENMRNPVANTKDRSEVSGGGRKPWRQKGTGNARHGSIRSPLWVGGGVTFGPSNEQNYKKRLNKKFRKKVLSSIFDHLIRNNKLSVLAEVDIKGLKTSNADVLIEKIGLLGKVCLFLDESEMEQKRAFRNLPYVLVMDEARMDVTNLISADHVLFTKKAFDKYFQTKSKIEK